MVGDRQRVFDDVIGPTQITRTGSSFHLRILSLATRDIEFAILKDEDYRLKIQDAVQVDLLVSLDTSLTCRR